MWLLPYNTLQTRLILKIGKTFLFFLFLSLRFLSGKNGKTWDASLFKIMCCLQLMQPLLQEHIEFDPFLA